MEKSLSSFEFQCRGKLIIAACPPMENFLPIIRHFFRIKISPLRAPDSKCLEITLSLIRSFLRALPLLLPLSSVWLKSLEMSPWSAFCGVNSSSIKSKRSTAFVEGECLLMVLADWTPAVENLLKAIVSQSKRSIFRSENIFLQARSYSSISASSSGIRATFSSILRCSSFRYAFRNSSLSSKERS